MAAMPIFESIKEIEQWFVEKIEATRESLEGQRQNGCDKKCNIKGYDIEGCDNCARKALMSDEIEDLTMKAAFEVEYFKSQEENAIAMSYAKENLLEDDKTIDTIRFKSMEINSTKEQCDHMFHELSVTREALMKSYDDRCSNREVLNNISKQLEETSLEVESKSLEN